MKNKLLIVDFIKTHPNWEAELASDPYCLKISRDRMLDRNLIMLKYNQVYSDFKNEIVRECRGLVLDEDTLEPVSVPFFKFGNAGEIYCPNIDWKNCWVGEKLDGSLIKIVKDKSGKLLVSTNGTIDAGKAPIAEQIGCTAKSFRDLVEDALRNARQRFISDEHWITKDMDEFDWLSSLLVEGVTYMFELVSPFTQVVVKWPETKMFYLGCRRNDTLQEMYFTDGILNTVFETPKVYQLGSIEQCIAAAKALNAECDNGVITDEGFVVCDNEFNRVKIKSPLYVAAHGIINNGVLSYSKAIELIRANDTADFTCNVAEQRFKDDLEKVRKMYSEFKNALQDSLDKLEAWIVENYPNGRWAIESGGCDRKKAAAKVFEIKFKNSAVAFSYLDGKVKSANEWLNTIPSNNIVKMLGLKEQNPEEKHMIAFTNKRKNLKMDPFVLISSSKKGDVLLLNGKYKTVFYDAPIDAVVVENANAVKSSLKIVKVGVENSNNLEFSIALQHDDDLKFSRDVAFLVSSENGKTTAVEIIVDASILT